MRKGVPMNIPEFKIKDKVVSIMGKLGYKQQAKRLEADRAAARIANICSQEFDRAIHEFERYMVRFIHQTIKDELK